MGINWGGLFNILGGFLRKIQKWYDVDLNGIGTISDCSSFVFYRFHISHFLPKLQNITTILQRTNHTIFTNLKTSSFQPFFLHTRTQPRTKYH